MKNLFTFLFIALLSITGLKAQTDSVITAKWQFPIDFWFPNATAPEGGIQSYERFQAAAEMVADFDAASANFDEKWASVAGSGNIIGSTPERILGLAGSNKGAEDFKDAAFKVMYDAGNMYILLQWTDDDVTGTETAELCISPYFKLDVDSTAKWYSRYSQFGANKLVFDKNGFNSAMMVNFNAEGKGSINWGGTTETLTNNLFLDNKTATGSKTVKWIITIGFPALTGEFRPEFNAEIWKALNEGKGISFDMKVNDVDGDDALNADATPVKKPAEYWWSSKSNESWQSNMYAGFVKANEGGTGGQTDTEITAKWQFPIDWWFPNAVAPEGGVNSYERFQAAAEMVDGFDAASANFDEAWAGVAGAGNIIGSTPERILGLAGSNKGANDFKDAAFKVMYDAGNMYILVQWTDDDVTGTESAELCISPYFKLDVNDEAKWYSRYSQFGANKLVFDKNGFNSAMMVNFDAEGKGSINWGGTTEILTNNLFLDNKTATGSKNVKWVITVGFPALTGEFRPEFNADIWKALNEGKGISFDMKVNDVDGDDALNTDATPVKKPAEYWWSSKSNESWQSNMYAGFVKANEGGTGGQTDAEITAKWQFPIDWWFPNAVAPEGGVESYERFQASAQFQESFDPASAKFDETWAGLAGSGNIIGSTPDRILGLAGSNKGANDLKDAAFKVMYDANNMYVLVQWTDDDVTGTESAEICVAPYFRLDVADEAKWYSRYSQFGANKLLFDKNGFNAAMMVNFDADGKGSINWGGTTETLTNNLFLDNKTATGSKTVKWIITIGYAALTGEYRPEFNVEIWKALNEGKGISFDMKVNDVDGDDALNTDATPVKKPAEYWWSSKSNDCWQSNMFAGFVNAKGGTVGIAQVISAESIFGQITNTRIQLTRSANVAVYNVLGQQMKSLRNVNTIEIDDLKSGIYIIRAENETRKIYR